MAQTDKNISIDSDLKKEDWWRYIYDLLEIGYLKQEGEYPVLKLTQKGKKVLLGKERVMLVAVKTKVDTIQTSPSYEKELFIKLKSIRTKLAIEANVPAYIVFSDASLIELSTYLPQTISDLKQISGANFTI